ncbi:D-alanyl-D-alanine carboxypeptidase family protein [Lyngbya aestuarii]|uniref:D-alanyl-D-alanine carboxypeptidase family protein n=1 Tax=Lyngbya aestuarii TaxID=118322 RepID=UPI00403DE521
MNNEGLPEQSANFSEFSEPTIDDIPEAVRDTPEVRRRSWPSSGLVVAALVGFVVLILSMAALIPKPEAEQKTATPQTDASPEATTIDSDNLLGHLPYQEAPERQLQPISYDGRLRLRAAAAEKFLQMSAAAGADGVVLAPLSGFRSVAEQEYLFFGVKEQRGQVALKRAEVSAPPGHSEHHTGYAVDIGDGRTPATNLSQKFENTAAFQWLERNAAHYSFELSFPRNNPQGVSYEPWHWRFVGDTDSLETFYKAQQLTRATPNQPQEASPEP